MENTENTENAENTALLEYPDDDDVTSIKERYDKGHQFKYMKYHHDVQEHLREEAHKRHKLHLRVCVAIIFGCVILTIGVVLFVIFMK